MTDDHSQHTTLQAANKRRRTARASTSQIEALLAYLERQPFLATRRFTGLQSRENYIFAWEAVAADLNSIPNGATKTADQWITVWRDIKSRACSKAARLQREKKETGNRNINTLPLTEIESRVVSIVGPDYTIGSNCPDSMPESDITQSDSVTGIEMEMGEYEVPSPDTPPEIYLNAATNMAAAVPAVTHTVTGQQFAAFDHTYVTLTSELPTMTSTSRSSLTSRPVTNTVTSSRMSSAAQEQTPPRRNRNLNPATNMAAAVPAVTHTVTGQQFAAFDNAYVTLTSEIPTMTSTSRSSLTSRPVTNTVTSSRMSSAAQEQTPPRRNRNLNPATNMAAVVPAVTHTVTGQFAPFDNAYVTLTSEIPTMTSTSRSSLTSRPVTNTVTNSRISSAAQVQTSPRRNRNLNPRRTVAQQLSSARADFLAIAESNAESMRMLAAAAQQQAEAATVQAEAARMQAQASLAFAQAANKIADALILLANNKN